MQPEAITAAGEAGNAKALHNLAVLYAEGIDGKPDYQTAAKWFRKAADYGTADSQYNLAILHTRHRRGAEPVRRRTNGLPGGARRR